MFLTESLSLVSPLMFILVRFSSEILIVNALNFKQYLRKVDRFILFKAPHAVLRTRFRRKKIVSLFVRKYRRNFQVEIF